MTTSAPSLQTIRRRGTAAAIAVIAAIAMTACGSSSSPLASSGATTTGATTATTVAPTTTTPTTAAPTTAAPTTTTPPTTAPPTTPAPTTTEAPTTTTAGGGGSVTAYCDTVAVHAQTLEKDGLALEKLSSTKPPTAAQTRDVVAIAKLFRTLVPLAPSAIKPDITTAARAYAALAVAFKTKNFTTIRTAELAFEQSAAVKDLLKVDTFESSHCTKA